MIIFCFQDEKTQIMFPKVTVVDPSFLSMTLSQLVTSTGSPPPNHSTSTLELRLTSFLQVEYWTFLWLDGSTNREVESPWK